jgi:hypothetical protein
VFQPFPTRRIRRENVVHAFDGNQFFTHILIALCALFIRAIARKAFNFTKPSLRN